MGEKWIATAAEPLRNDTEETAAGKLGADCHEQQSCSRNDSVDTVSADEVDWQLLMFLEKKAGEDAWKGKLEFSHTAGVIKGLAIMIQQCAGDLNVPVGYVVARLASVLLGPGEEKKGGKEKQSADA